MVGKRATHANPIYKLCRTRLRDLDLRFNRQHACARVLSPNGDSHASRTLRLTHQIDELGAVSIRILTECLLRFTDHVFEAEPPGVLATSQELREAGDGGGELHVLLECLRHAGIHENGLFDQP